MKIALLKKYLPEFLIIICSFFLFSTRFYPALNSDDALSVLMTHDFAIPDAIYCWGQDRGGSLIPLLGQIFHSCFGISSVWAESITHHIILIIGYFCFATIFKSKFSKVLIAVVWFLPPLYFIGYVRYSWGILYSLIGIIIWLTKLYSDRKGQKIIPRIAILFSIIFLSIISTWVLDQAIIILTTIAFLLLFEKYRTQKSIKLAVFNLEALVISIGYVLIVVVILKLKALAVTSQFDNYNTRVFNSIGDIIDSIRIIFVSIFEVLTFKTSNFLFSIYAHLSILTLVYSVPRIRNKKIQKINKQWIIIFITISAIILLTILCSNWVYNNGVARRYFSGIYFMSWLSFLLYIEQCLIKKMLKSLIILTILIGSLSTMYHYKYISPKRLTSKYQIVKEFEKLGKVGLIAEYWNAYSSSFFNPDLIKATPHDKSNIRNWNYVDSVLAQEKIYFIRDMWLDSFPDQITQFGVDFTRIENESYIGGCWINKYKKEQIDRIYFPSDMKIRGSQNSTTSNHFYNDSDNINTHVVFGPFIDLPKGNFRVSFDINIDKIVKDGEFAIMEISSDGGKQILLEKRVKTNSSVIGNNQIQLDLKCNQYLKNVEFRIFYLGGVDFIFNKVCLIERQH